ncbi:filamentous hemagglutinin family outer membrane protein [Gloeocapsa sp. PCC 7428]|uniref:filamentous hemagglutinin N-terminal domain-containing protein n=1 Tax=Gloeocapsa sp. PCC 7428 TaxID=1173026 RepID=UPI0002A5E278|nr:filamentous hemagglutinin N-terminal domain-containing protein [Gloeocapsa sp. PCC 7428]AFZ32648.1 filamentous hemagglutinin family outer membrane protein [Gloeocapsa sp. PCC 7428]
MVTSWNYRCSLVTASSAIAVSFMTTAFNCALAQITPDNTLGTESSIITPNTEINGIPSTQINGGAIHGQNLFHSFQQFNIAPQTGAYFSNPAGVENIFSRVTGGVPSNIQGTLGVLGNANLFLINPNGIIFGPSSRLDISGSLIASTASSLNFADGTSFSATTPQTTPLLTMSVPIGLQFGTQIGSIVLQGIGGNLGYLQNQGLGEVKPDKTLALVGGDITLNRTYLGAPSGRIELGSVAEPGLVNLKPATNGWSLGYEGIQHFGKIQMTRSFVDASIYEPRIGTRVHDDPRAIAITADLLDLHWRSSTVATNFHAIAQSAAPETIAPTLSTSLVEATQWMTNNGEVILVATAPTSLTYNQFTTASCHVR